MYEGLLESVAVNIPQLPVRWKQLRNEMLLSVPKPLFTHWWSLVLVTSLLVLLNQNRDLGPALVETQSHRRALDSDGGERCSCSVCMQRG